MNIIKDNTEASFANVDREPPTVLEYVNPDHVLKISVFFKKFPIFATAWSKFEEQNKCFKNLLDTAKILKGRQAGIFPRNIEVRVTGKVLGNYENTIYVGVNSMQFLIPKEET